MKFDETGSVWPLGIPVAQSWNEIGMIMALIHEFNIDLFVELGMQAGGLSSLLMHRTEYQEDFSYIGIENKKEDIHPKLLLKNRHLKSSRMWIKDAFSDVVSEWLRKPFYSHNRTFLYCDNGDKPRELKHFAPQLYESDILAVHDIGREVFSKDMAFLKDDFEQLSRPYFEGCAIAVFQKK